MIMNEEKLLFDENTLYILPEQDRFIKVSFSDSKYQIKLKNNLEFEFIIKESLKFVDIEVGLKVEVRDNILKKLQEEEYINENFKLNIKRLNRWWYSVYFDKKEI